MSEIKLPPLPYAQDALEPHMSAKTIIFDTRAREKILRGVDTLANAVKVTLADVGLEASSLDLDGTELVVLSACETGLGDVSAGDGVYGLRRALVIAGAESQVMTLWRVDDSASRDLMEGFYKRLRDGEGRAEALRQSQLTLMRDPKRAHPFFWAAFIQSGAAEPLRASRPRR